MSYGTDPVRMYGCTENSEHIRFGGRYVSVYRTSCRCRKRIPDLETTGTSEMDSREYRVFYGTPGDAAEIAKVLTAERDDAKVIVIVGGEGTYNEVLNGVSFRGLLTFGYVPAGFRNALSKGFESFWKVNCQAKRILHPKYYRMLDYGSQHSEMRRL